MGKVYVSSFNGVVEYRLDVDCPDNGGELHCADGPAKIWLNLGEAWHLYGKEHRYYGPCTTWKKEWIVHGRRVR